MSDCYIQIEDFFPNAFYTELLSYVLAHESAFIESDLTQGNGLYYNNKVRKSRLMRNFPEIKPQLKRAFKDALPLALAHFNIPDAEPYKTEIEIVATGDGGFFSRHSDTITGTHQPGYSRVLTAVYYFYNQPKAFTGGELRIYPLLQQLGKTYIDIEPKNNSLILFPSFIPHEVMPVTLPSSKFMDSRFSINCWYNRALQ